MPSGREVGLELKEETTSVVTAVTEYTQYRICVEGSLNNECVYV